MITVVVLYWAVNTAPYISCKRQKVHQHWETPRYFRRLRPWAHLVTWHLEQIGSRAQTGSWGKKCILEHNWVQEMLWKTKTLFFSFRDLWMEHLNHNIGQFFPLHPWNTCILTKRSWTPSKVNVMNASCHLVPRKIKHLTCIWFEKFSLAMNLLTYLVIQCKCGDVAQSICRWFLETWTA